MKKILIFIITLCFAFITVLPTVFTFAFGGGDYNMTPYISAGGNGHAPFDLSGYEDNLQSKNLPYLLVKYDELVTNQYDDDYNKLNGRYIIIYPNVLGSTLVKNGNIITSTSGTVTYGLGGHDTHNNITPMDTDYSDPIFGQGSTSSFDISTYISGKSSVTYNWFNGDGADLGQNDFVPPVPLSDMDLKDIPVNTMRIRKPSSSSQIETTKNLIFADDDFFTWEVDGKIGLVGNYKDNINKIKNLNEGEILVMKPIFPNCLEFTKNVSVEFLGNESDWISNGFITFKATGEVLLDKVTPVDNASLTLGCNFVNQADGFLGSSRVYTWVNDTVNFNLGLHSDVNGDGVDDNTGEVIPADSPIDSNGDGKLDGGGSTDFIQDFTKTIKNIPSYTSDITSAFSSILGFLPQPIPILIVGALATMIFVTVISFIRGN